MKTKRPLADLIVAAQKVIGFAARFHTQYYRADDNSWDFERKVVFAGVSVGVCDDEGGPIWEPDYPPVGTPRIMVDIERFREHGRTRTESGRAELAEADAAEKEIIAFCESLGFEVKFESNVGSGPYGSINQITLT